ncbi:hypothetical protein DFP73DRAFT_594082 [Morchella snyderi]|nr:hypothetical protein DFP73DRAFT_594082 [Morchella snyderi]
MSQYWHRTHTTSAGESSTARDRSQSTDEKPYGLKVLYEGKEPTVDLVCVHGLNGHREHTWTANNGVLWLRDLLPGKIPNIRVLTYGYDSRTRGSTQLSCQTLHDHAVDLITNMHQERSVTATKERPIIFLAHSTGGIVVKEALIYSNSTNMNNLEHHKDIKISTYGILFFGTPHQGVTNLDGNLSGIVPWRAKGSRASIKNTILRDLEENSNAIQKQLTEYKNISKDFVTKFLYETYRDMDDGKFFVPKSSAVVPGAANTEVFAVNSVHEELVKYQYSTDQAFRQSSSCLKEMVNSAPDIIKENWLRWTYIRGISSGNKFKNENYPALPPAEEDQPDRRSILRWLSKDRVEEDYERLYMKRHDQTGSWLLESKEYREWRKAPKNCLLWCHGTAGVGKSVLAKRIEELGLYLFIAKKNGESIVVKDITDRCVDIGLTGIAYFYFNFQNEAAQTMKNFFGVLLKQLSGQKTRLPPSLLSLYKRCFEKKDQVPGLGELQAQFHEIIQTFNHVFLVVDALDECKKNTQRHLLPYIVNLMQGSFGRVKLLVTSRPYPEIELEFASQGFETIKIEATRVKNDIAAFVNHELTHRPHRYVILNEELRGKIRGELISKGNGMFLWAKCQVDYIYEQPSERAIQDALKQLPEDMTETYRRMFAKLQNQTPLMARLGIAALVWATTALEPLSPQGLAAAIAIEATSESKDQIEDTYAPHVAIDACCGFLCVESDSLVRPIHFTVREFLRGDGQSSAAVVHDDIPFPFPNQREAYIQLAAASVRYMLLDRVKGRSKHAPEHFNSIRGGSTGKAWCIYVYRLKPPLSHDDELARLIRCLLRSENYSMVWEYMSNPYDDEDECDFLVYKSHPSLLQMCAAFDLMHIYDPDDDGYFLDGSGKDFMEVLNDPNDPRIDHSCFAVQRPLDNVRELRLALARAAYAGAVDAAAWLLDHIHRSGHDMHRSGHETGNFPLYLAVKGNRLEMLSLLLERGLEPNGASAFEDHASTVLHDLCWKYDYTGGNDGIKLLERMEMLRLLVIYGADLDAHPGEYGTALQIAAHLGDCEFVQALLEYGASVNINITSKKYRTVLQAAVLPWPFGPEKVKPNILRLLLRDGADPNVCGGPYGTALQAASYYYQSKECIELLLDCGAHVNMQGGPFGNALQASCAYRTYNRSVSGVIDQRGREGITQCLIERGADVNLLGGIYGTALHAAAFAGYKSTVLLLLRLGASPHTLGAWGMNVLEMAIYGGHLHRSIDRGMCESDTPTEYIYTDQLLRIDWRIITNAEWDDADGGTQRYYAYESRDIGSFRERMDSISSQGPHLSPWQRIINDLLSVGAQSSILKDPCNTSCSTNGEPFFPLEGFQGKENQECIDLCNVQNYSF